MTLLCTFTVDEHLLGIEIDRVLEFLRDQPVTAVPLAPPSVAGLLNLRGQIVTAVDARSRFGMAAATTAPVSMVLQAAGESVSLLVDHEGEVLEADDSMTTDIPASISDTLRSFTTGAILIDGELVLALDPDLTLSVATS
jgi:purine-binding chemotaxis protein CheW